MNKMKILSIAFVLLFAVVGPCFAGGTYSGRALEESARASWHASKGVVNGIVASGQAVSAVASVPFAIAGSAAGVSTGVANGLMDAATATPGAPFPVSDETVTAGVPPDQALKPNEDPGR